MATLAAIRPQDADAIVVPEEPPVDHFREESTATRIDVKKA